MSLTPGQRLGPYEVVGAIGAGGMGEVYRARDAKLNRDVALKVLPASVAGDADRLTRFRREAQVLASLNHPNIGHIYGFEDSGTTHALVLELIEGPTLADRIAQGPIPLTEALPIARQMADALEAAHEQGIIHRDLKPANIKIRPDGTVKVLDFGLAKAMDPASPGSVNVMNSPTLSMHATQAGIILGTAAYMSPEQAAGKTVDQRSDLWSFGVVLVEMLTGLPVFPGETVSHVLAAVLKTEPDWTTLPPDTPAAARRLLRRCLEKDRKRRLDSASDARLEIDDALNEPPAPGVTSAPGRQPRSAWAHALMWTWGASTLALLALALLWAPWRSGPGQRHAAVRFTPFSFEQGGQTGPIWSPDGKAVAFGARPKDTEPYQIYVRYLDSPVATQITHLAVSALPIDWTSAGRIVFHSSQAPAGLWSISPVGGEPEPLQGLDRSGVGRRLRPRAASVSRDGTALAWYGGDDGVSRIWISSPPGSAPKPYQPAPFASRDAFNSPTLKFSPDGTQLLLIRNAGAGEEAWLMPYPPNAGKPPRRILQGLPPASENTPDVSWMPDNRHVVLSTTPGGAPPQLYMADTVSGAFYEFSSGTTAQRSPAVSPDGSKLLFLEAATNYDIVSVDLASAAVTPLIATQRSEQMPAWASKASALVYVTDRNGEPEIWLHKPGQSDRPVVTARDFPANTTRALTNPCLSPDATRVIYTRLERAGPGRLWMSAVAGGSPVQLLKSTAERDWAGSWSPDGNWLVYWSRQDGRTSLNKVKTTGQAQPEVLKVDIQRLGQNWLPLWSPSGDWILHVDGEVKLTSPDGKTTRTLSSTSALAYAFSADGQQVYGLRRLANGPLELFSIDLAGGTEKAIGALGQEYLPDTSFSPGLRLTVTPDGKSATYSTSRSTSNLWLMEGLNGLTRR